MWNRNGDGMRMRGLTAALALLLGAASGAAAHQPAEIVQEQPGAHNPTLGVFTTLPLAWGAVDDLSAILAEEHRSHWARTVIERSYRYAPLDWLDSEALAPFDRLLLAQPRALAPAENVALDQWVRDGGTVLLFADPLLGTESGYGFGDRRAPQAVALLSPLLGRWGLTLQFDDTQSADAYIAQPVGWPELPVILAGTLEPNDAMVGPDTRCEITAERLVADCTIGSGRAIVIADATLLEPLESRGGLDQLWAEWLSAAFASGY